MLGVPIKKYGSFNSAPNPTPIELRHGPLSSLASLNEGMDGASTAK